MALDDFKLKIVTKNLPPQDIDINGDKEGELNPKQKVEVNLVDSNSDPVTPDSIDVTGNVVTLEVPSVAPPPPPPTGDHLVRFFDIDGTILKEEFVDNGNDATAPDDPDFDPTYLTFKGWNIPFTNVQHDLDVGSEYDTVDGATYFFVRITNTTGLQPTLRFSKGTTDLMTVDWGDSTSDTTSSSGVVDITKTAAYSSIGDYVIKVTCAGFYGNVDNVNIVNGDNPYARMFLKIYFGSMQCDRQACLNFNSLQVVSINGDNLATGNRSGIFSSCHSLVHCTLPNVGVDMNAFFRDCFSLKSVCLAQTINFNNPNAFFNCYNLKKIIYMGYSGNGNTSIFQNCYSLERLILDENMVTYGTNQHNFLFAIKTFKISPNVTTLGNNSLANLRNLVELDVPDSVTTINDGAFNNNTSCLEYVFRSTTPPTLANVNAFLNINAACKIYVPDASVAAYKAATNWATYADYIYPLSTKP